MERFGYKLIARQPLEDGSIEVTLDVERNCIRGKWRSPSDGESEIDLATTIEEILHHLGVSNYDLRLFEFFPREGYDPDEDGIPGEIKIKFRRLK